MEFLYPAQNLSHSDTVLRRARSLGIFPSVHEWAKTKWGEIPHCFEQEHWHSIARRKWLSLSIKHILRDFPDVPCVLLKGALWGEQFYSHSQYRESSDIDLLLRVNDMPLVEKHLESLGYHRVDGSRDWASNQHAFFHEGGRAPVELHWQLAPPPLPQPPIDLCLELSTPHPLYPKFLSLAGHYVYLHMILHAMQHWGALKPILDLIAFWDSGVDDWEKLHEFAKSYHLEKGSLFFALVVSLIARRPHPLSCQNHVLYALAKRYVQRFEAVLVQSSPWRENTRLVWGEDSHAQAAKGVLERSFSMFLIDDRRQACQAFSRVLLDGPHFIGRLFHQGLSAISS